MNQNPTIIDQNLKVALAAGKRSNNFIYYAPQANVGTNIPEKYDGPMQMLYAICAEFVNQDMTLKDFQKLSRLMMIQAAKDKHGNVKKAAEALGVGRIYDAAQLEILE